MTFPKLQRPHLATLNRQLSRLSRWMGIATITLFTFHVLSILLFAVLGLAPGSDRWSLLLTFTGVLAVAGTAVSIQSYAQRPWVSRLWGTISGTFAGVILGFFVGGELGDRQPLWVMIGFIAGGMLLGSLAFWAYRNNRVRERGVANFCGGAIALISSLCAYTLAFGLTAWSWMALSTGRLGLVILLSPLAVAYLWCTRQGLRVFWQCWQCWH